METNETLTQSPCMGIELLRRAEAELATALQSCESAVTCLAPAGGGLPHVPALAVAVGAVMSSIGNLEMARLLLGQIHDTGADEAPHSRGHGEDTSNRTSERRTQCECPNK